MSRLAVALILVVASCTRASQSTPDPSTIAVISATTATRPSAGVPDDWLVAQKNGFAGITINSVGWVDEPDTGPVMSWRY